MRSTPFRTLAFTTSYSAFGLIAASMLAACGPSRLSDGDVDRLCMLQVRCAGGLITQEACVASIESQRDTMNMQGCGGQFGAVARCAIRADECTSGVPEDCLDEQMRLTTCMNRRDSGPAMPGTDAAIVVPDANVGCPSTSEEFGSTYCLDGCDNDGDLTIDCNDETCCGSIECPSGTVCGGGSCEPASFEEGSYCFDGCDNDGDAVFDCNDSGCCASLEGSCGSGTVCGTPSCEPASLEEETYCEDGCDNDGDGVFDCNDSGCCAWLSGTCATGTLCGGSGGSLYHGWVSPISGCSTTSYDSTAPTALGGTYPYNTADSLACRAWKLAATVCTTAPTQYNGTNDNWTCPASGGFTDPTFGTYCASPGTQYACSTCPGACNASCTYTPLSLRDCSNQEVDQL